MRDVVFEWYVPHVLSKKERLAKALTVSAAAVFFIDAVLFMAAMLFPAAALALAGFILSRRWNYEYEYVYVNGDFTISKILHKSRRKDVCHMDRTDFEELIPGRAAPGGTPVKDFTSGLPDKPVYTIRTRGGLICIEAEEGFISEMKKYYPITDR